MLAIEGWLTIVGVVAVVIAAVYLFALYEQGRRHK
jgi:hypothetical protein